MADQGPIFIGGTGRSGTSVMGDLLNSHPAIVLPAHENKLIVEKDGLRDLVGQLGDRFDMKRQHYAVANFIRWARRLRTFGFGDPALNQQLIALRETQGMAHDKACEAVARANPAAYVSLHAVGRQFGLAHYDKCVNDFVGGLCGNVVNPGIFDTEGLLAPFFIPKVTTRTAALAACRRFLDGLYAPALAQASAARWCDDTPSNWMYLDFLHELYPDMKFIHMVRDPRDVVGSYLKQVWAPPDPAVIVAIFKAQFADYERIRSRVPADRVIEIRLEDISEDKPRTLDRLSAFLGVENLFEGEVFFQEKTHTGTYADTLGDEAVALIETELADWMERRRYLA